MENFPSDIVKKYSNMQNLPFKVTLYPSATEFFFMLFVNVKISFQL